MSDYILNKVLSFAAVFLCILVTYALFGYTTTQWQIILLCVVVFGYAHFLVGFYYQIKGFARTERPVVRYVTFLLLTLLSIGIAYLIFAVFGFVAGLFLGFLYFLLHGLLNEQTLILRQTGLSVPLLPLWALAIFIISLLIYSVPDKTFFFDYALVFHPVSDYALTQIFNTKYLNLMYFPIIFWGGLSLAAVLLFVAWRRYEFPRMMLTVGLFITVLTGFVLLLAAPPYIYMYLFVVGYHFMTWLLFYSVEFKRRGTGPWRNFILINVGVFGLLGYLLSVHHNEPTALTAFVFDYRVFVVLTYIHISTSFMNDAWCKNLESKIAGHFFNR